MSYQIELRPKADAEEILRRDFGDKLRIVSADEFGIRVESLTPEYNTRIYDALKRAGFEGFAFDSSIPGNLEERRESLAKFKREMAERAADPKVIAYDRAVAAERAKAGVEFLAEFSSWVRTGLDPETGKVFSERVEAAKLFPDEKDVIDAEYEDAIETLRKIDYAGPVLVAGFICGNNWEEVVVKFDTLERMGNWLFDRTGANVREVMTRYNEVAVAEGRPKLRATRNNALNVLRQTKTWSGDEWNQYISTIPEIIEALTTGGQVPVYATAEAQEDVIKGEADKLRKALKAVDGPKAEDADGTIQ